MIYLDYAANTPIEKEVLDTYYQATMKYFANPNASHTLGLQAKEVNWSNNKAHCWTITCLTWRSIISWRKHNDLTFINCACRFTEGCSLINDGTSKRKEVKELIKTMKQVNPNVDQNIFKALDNVNLDCILGTKKDKAYHSFLENYEK